jgi:hypothetical protein
MLIYWLKATALLFWISNKSKKKWCIIVWIIDEKKHITQLKLIEITNHFSKAYQQYKSIKLFILDKYEKRLFQVVRFQFIKTHWILFL